MPSKETIVFATQGGGGSPMSLRNSAGSVITSRKRIGVMADNLTRVFRRYSFLRTSDVPSLGETHVCPFESYPF